MVIDTTTPPLCLAMCTVRFCSKKLPQCQSIPALATVAAAVAADGIATGH